LEYKSFGEIVKVVTVDQVNASRIVVFC